MHVEESLSGQKLSKDYRWRIAEITSVLRSESLNNIYIYINNLHPHMLFGRLQEKSFSLNCSIFSCQTRLELQRGPDSMVR